jgi:hypothetical protein
MEQLLNSIISEPSIKFEVPIPKEKVRKCMVLMQYEPNKSVAGKESQDPTAKYIKRRTEDLL